MLEGADAPKILKHALAAGRIGDFSAALDASSADAVRTAMEAAYNPYHGAHQELFLQGKMVELLAAICSTANAGEKRSCKFHRGVPAAVRENARRRARVKNKKPAGRMTRG